MSLYLKYRPQNFASVVGQKHTKTTLQSAVEHDNLAHAYLFCGPRGTGKTSMARILAKRINCLSPQKNEPCNQCEICMAIQNGQLVDLIEIDAASNRGIDEIRELREKIGFSPTQAKKKVYIIDEVHMLTKEAFNALLKTLEEPPEHAYFILATTEAHKIPETIISRCQQFNFERINNQDISERLEEIVNSEGGSAEKEALELIAQLSQGGLRDAIGLLEQMMASGPITAEAVRNNLGLIGQSYLENFYNSLQGGDKAETLELLAELKKQGRSLNQFLKELLHFLQKKLHENINDTTETQNLLRHIDAFLEAKRQMDLSPIPELPIEMAILRDETIIPTVNQHENKPMETLKTTERKGGIVPATPPIQKKKEAAVTTPNPSPLPQDNAEKMEIQPASPQAHTANTTEEGFSGPIDFETIQAKWPRVLEHIQTPFIRMSLSNGQLQSYESGALNLEFKSSSFKDKVGEGSGQREVQDALVAVFGGPIKLNLKLKEIQLHHTPQHSDPADMAADVFGIKS